MKAIRNSSEDHRINEALMRMEKNISRFAR